VHPGPDSYSTSHGHGDALGSAHGHNQRESHLHCSRTVEHTDCGGCKFNKVVITDNLDSNSYPLPAAGGTQSVIPTATTIYTATATGASGQPASAQATVTVSPLGKPTVT